METDNEAFRDKIANVDADGRRVWMYPKKVKGRLYKYRTYISWGLLTILFSGPFIKINGEPLLLVNVLERKFVLFGQVFWPQDFHLAVVGTICMFVFVILFTVVYGRVFCGWICPQTIFLEMVYRKIEYFLEGDGPSQRRLNKGPWTTRKMVIKTIKQSIFFGIAFLVANVFLAYIISIEELWDIVLDHPREHAGGLIALLIFAGIFYFVFAFFREQACTNVCPYGRLQSVLQDDKTIMVSYDYLRGENRAKYRKNQDRKSLGLGDCIDCGACFKSCPTGVDIRNGTQLECVNCTSCMDACDHVMDKVNSPKGLIRLASEHEIKTGESFAFTGRMKAYTVVLVLLLVFLTGLLFTRSDTETTIFRPAGSMFNRAENGDISNVYQFKIFNKTNETKGFRFELDGFNAELTLVSGDDSLWAGDVIQGALLITAKPEEVTQRKQKVSIKLISNDRVMEEVETVFLGPLKR